MNISYSLDVQVMDDCNQPAGSVGNNAGLDNLNMLAQVAASGQYFHFTVRSCPAMSKVMRFICCTERSECYRGRGRTGGSARRERRQWTLVRRGTGQ